MSELTFGEKADRFVTYFAPLLFLLFTGKKPDLKGKDGEQILKTGIFDFLTGQDEASFMEVVAEISKDERTIDGEGKDIVINWLASLENSHNAEKEKIPYRFRKYVTSHPDKEARIQILLSYAREKDDDARTLRFETETFPAWIQKMVLDKAKQGYEYVTGEGWVNVKERLTNNMSTLAEKMQADIEKMKNEIGGQS